MKTSLIHYFEETVARSADRIAVWDAGKTYSFQEVFARAQKVSAEIHSQDASVRRIVAVYLPKCAGVTVADFGILMTGNGFMNLDVKTPVERIGEILKTIEPLTMITDEMRRKNIAHVVRLAA